MRAARGDLEAALAQLTSAQDRLGKLGYGLEEARAAFALARLRGRRTAAGTGGREGVAGAAPAFDEAARMFPALPGATLAAPSGGIPHHPRTGAGAARAGRAGRPGRAGRDGASGSPRSSWRAPPTGRSRPGCSSA
ncbi:hypothetical protein LT493_32005 [Streptomyces tricolor]|nr:hypothetical protein [Streptomyces tricolor]